jgi:hypothetical protein
MAPGFRCHDQWEVQLQAQIQLKASVHVYAGGLTDEELRRALVIPCRAIEETVARLRRAKPGATIAVLPDGPQTVPTVGESRTSRGEMGSSPAGVGCSVGELDRRR